MCRRNGLKPQSPEKCCLKFVKSNKICSLQIYLTNMIYSTDFYLRWSWNVTCLYVEQLAGVDTLEKAGIGPSRIPVFRLVWCATEPGSCLFSNYVS